MAFREICGFAGRILGNLNAPRGLGDEVCGDGGLRGQEPVVRSETPAGGAAVASTAGDEVEIFRLCGDSVEMDWGVATARLQALMEIRSGGRMTVEKIGDQMCLVFHKKAESEPPLQYRGRGGPGCRME